MNKLSLEQKIGQRFIMGVNNNNISIIINLIKNAYLGGVILYKKNYSNYIEMLQVIKSLKAANINNPIPLFIAIDQEGGYVNRFPKEINNLSNIYDLTKNTHEKLPEYVSILSKLLSDTGINLNLAPVMDIDNELKSLALYKRCFYGNIDDITNYSKTYINILKENNIIAVPKHFPGHGISKKDSHFIIPYIFNYHKVLNYHIKPFLNILNHDAIMIGHLTIHKLTKLLPSSISPHFINTYLLDKYNYQGLIITDEINMLKRNPFYHFIYLKKALSSPSDILLIKIKDEKEAYHIINKYQKLLHNNPKLLNNLDNSVNKIINIKNKYHINDNTNYSGIDINEINEIITKINN